MSTYCVKYFCNYSFLISLFRNLLTLSIKYSIISFNIYILILIIIWHFVCLSIIQTYRMSFQFIVLLIFRFIFFYLYSINIQANTDNTYSTHYKFHHFYNIYLLGIILLCILLKSILSVSENTF